MLINIVPLVIAVSFIGTYAFLYSELQMTATGHDAPASHGTVMVGLVDNIASAASADQANQIGKPNAADRINSFQASGKNSRDNAAVVLSSLVQYNHYRGIAPRAEPVASKSTNDNALYFYKKYDIPSYTAQDEQETLTAANEMHVLAAKKHTFAKETTSTHEPSQTEVHPTSTMHSSTGNSTCDSPSANTFSGDGTFYTPGLGACGKTNTESDLIAAINAPQYGNYANPNHARVCGKCARVKGPKGKVKVKIVDNCPVCKSGDLDLSPSAFEQIGEFDDGRIAIEWSFVKC